ncbi:MAG TPA: hypothetical protein VGU24_05405 [Microvirga sp.]|jgi:divalent metal cation (Fe/Co/Zn/Cd) transporter|nr:hypothetical protein [Microvirga sp.]
MARIADPLPRPVRLGLTLVAAGSLFLVAALVAAVALVGSIWLFQANVFALADGLVAVAVAVPLFLGLVRLMHQRLWGLAAA